MLFPLGYQNLRSEKKEKKKKNWLGLSFIFEIRENNLRLVYSFFAKNLQVIFR